MVAPVDAAQKHRPDSSAFKQQKLKVWRPILTPKKVVMLFSFLGLIFLPIGIAIIVASNQVRPHPPYPSRPWTQTLCCFRCSRSLHACSECWLAAATAFAATASSAAQGGL